RRRWRLHGRERDAGGGSGATSRADPSSSALGDLCGPVAGLEPVGASRLEEAVGMTRRHPGVDRRQRRRIVLAHRDALALRLERLLERHVHRRRVVERREHRSRRRGDPRMGAAVEDLLL
ncbi:MAG: hypothetical protein ACK55I_08860, partial [bacterium]